MSVHLGPEYALTVGAETIVDALIIHAPIHALKSQGPEMAIESALLANFHDEILCSYIWN